MLPAMLSTGIRRTLIMKHCRSYRPVFRCTSILIARSCFLCVFIHTPQPASRPATAKPSDKHRHLASTHPTCPAPTGRGATKRRTRNDCRHCCRQPMSTTTSPVEEAHMAPSTNLGKHLIPAPRESLLGRSRKHKCS